VIPDSISHYRIIKKIGSGGMGEVFLAEDTRLRRKVALKLLSADLVKNQDRLRRFEQEAFAASALSHPNILVIYEVGVEGDARFIATEFIEGHTLRTTMSRERMTLREVMDLAIQTASALDAAHAAGVVHRDIKPENIMVKSGGHIKILDFGLAKLTEQHALSADTEAATIARVDTDPGTVMGTVSYMSPEQARGKSVDARSDIFSLGVVVYELIAGRAPFEGETTTDVLAAILKSEPPPLARYLSDAPAELQRIVSKALRKDKEERYQTAKDLLIDLKGLKDELDAQARLERSTSPEAGAVALSTSSGAAVTSAKEYADRTSGRTTSSAEYIVTSIKQNKKATAVVLAILLVGCAGLYFLVRPSAPPKQADETGAAQPKAISSLAVLPFANASHDPDAEFLSDGISESLINSLSQLSGLKVMARTTAFRYKGNDADPQAVGRELKVDAVLTGKITWQGDSLIVQADLINAADGSQMWGERYSRKVSGILAVQDEIARQISERLRLKLTGREEKLLAKKYTENTDAYQLYLKGRFQWNRRTGESLKNAVEFYKRAIELDPNYALAYVGLAECYVLFEVFSVAPARESMPQAKAAVEKALELDDSLAEAHAALGYYLTLFAWDKPAAEREFRRAIELNPNYPTAHHWYGSVLAAMGRFDESIAEGKRAEELDPLSPIISTDVGVNLFYARRFDEAIAQFKHALTLDTNFYFMHSSLGIAYDAKGMYAEAISAFRKAIELGNDPWDVAFLARSLARAGQRAEAVKLLGQLKAESARRYVSKFSIALIYAALGDKDQAIAWLEKDFAERTFSPPFYAVDPMLDDLRSDPRFADLVRRAASPQ
jgi:eukaryotic-like serine/threonine-protein kinase